MKTAMASLAAVIGFVWNVWASASVEITEAYQKTPGSGVVDCTYTVGASEGVKCTVLIKVGAKGCDKSVVLTNKNVTAGTVTTRVDVKALLGKAYPNVTLFAELSNLAVRLWEDGPYWASCNLGADKPEDSGYYFWWGGTVGCKRNSSNNGWVSVADGTAVEFKNAAGTADYGYPDDLRTSGYINDSGNLTPEHDAATACLGSPWRMPTSAEVQALVDNCETHWAVVNGVSGCFVNGKGAYSSNSIFLPASGRGSWSDLNDAGVGYCWSSTPYSDSDCWTYHIYVDSNGSKLGYKLGRDDTGLPVRPVQ